jgi:hypothetical protein
MRSKSLAVLMRRLRTTADFDLFLYRAREEEDRRFEEFEEEVSDEEPDEGAST